MCFSGLLHRVYWYFLTDVSGQSITPNFKGQDFQEHGTDMLSRNVHKNYNYTLSNILE